MGEKVIRGSLAIISLCRLVSPQNAADYNTESAEVLGTLFLGMSLPTHSPCWSRWTGLECGLKCCLLRPLGRVQLRTNSEQSQRIQPDIKLFFCRWTAPKTLRSTSTELGERLGTRAPAAACSFYSHRSRPWCSSCEMPR